MQVRNGLVGLLLALALPLAAHAASSYQVYVSNERSGDVTVIDGGDFHVVATIPDGKTIYVALSGLPIQPPPKLDAHGNPILKHGGDDDDDDEAKADKSADGIGVVDVASGKLKGKISVGSDPEEFDLSK